ncbi:ABC transporter permease [Candidatus Palauibacter sp.]|uniref:ABC transporter permease n=1 Tax=Candidatus Palauibacter sp. TaxID=3101350 RepID=UPI003B011D70
MWKILLEEFLGDLRAQKTRAFLTIFAVVWGTISIVLLLAFGQGLRNQFSTGLLNAGERIFMVYGGQTSMEHEGLSKGRRIRLREEDLDLLLRAVPEFEMGSPSYGRGRTHLKVGESQTTTYMEGVNHLLLRPRDVRDAAVAKEELFRVLGGRYRFAAADERALAIWDFIEDEKIVGQFLFEATLIAVGGGLAGLAIAALLVTGIDALPIDDPAMQYIVNPKLSAPIAAVCAGILMAIGLVAGILPARRAARLDPVESLRYE